MRNLKRFLALALTMLMVIGSFSLSAKSFPDTAEMTAEQVNALDVLSDLSIFLGKEDGTFGGAEEINRKEMAILASRIQTGEKFGSSYGENVTPFPDVVTDFEAILYASNMGIVIGDENGNFNPDAKVEYKDVLTMIVRTLGYKGAEMDAGYPSTYIVKANELGITKGISSLVTTSWTANVQRQQVAELLYNALFAVKADGTTAAEMFGIDTYVLTAMKDYNLTNVTCYDANGTRVVVQPLNADGSINDMYYHLPVSVFEEAGVEIVLGASYRIASTDNLETVKAITACPSVELAHDADENYVELSATGNVNLPGVDGKRVNYKAVNRYTTVYNTQGTHTADNEIIVYNQRGFNFTVSGDGSIWVQGFGEKYYYFMTDAEGNLLDGDGYIVAYYMPELNGVQTVYAPYYYLDEATGTYIPVDEEYLAEVALDAKPQDSSTVYHVWTGDQMTNGNYDYPLSSFTVTNKDDMYTAVAYDDDFDGDYDRLFFMYHSFGIGDSNNTINPYSSFTAGNGTNYGGAVNPYFADSAVAAGEPVRFYADAARKQTTGTYKQMNNLTSATATIVEKYELTTVSGLVTAVNGTKMTIGGNTYDIALLALHNFKDALPYGKDTANKYIGQNVTAVLFDGGIFEIKGSETTWLVFDNFTGLTTNGYVTALAFAGSTDVKNITIASIDGWFFMHYNANKPTSTGDNNIETLYDKLITGKLYTATKDAYGYYHISTQNNYYNSTAGDGVTYWDWSYGAGGDLHLNFKNGISWATDADGVTANNGEYVLYNPHWNAYAQNRGYFQPNKDMIWLFYDPSTKSFSGGTGIPTDGSKIFYSNNGVDAANPATWGLNRIHWEGNFFYAYGGTFSGSFTNSLDSVAMGTPSYDVVYVTADAAKNYTVDNVVSGLEGPGETLYGFRYKYSTGVFSFMTGDDVTVCTDGIYNYKLEEGFYTVKNGIIDRKFNLRGDKNADGTDFDCPIDSADISDSNAAYLKLTVSGGATSSTVEGGTVYEFDRVPYRIYGLTCQEHTSNFVWPNDANKSFGDGKYACWTSIQAYGQSQNFGAINGGVRVFYAKAALASTDRPIVLVAITQAGDGNGWGFWRGYMGGD